MCAIISNYIFFTGTLVTILSEINSFAQQEKSSRLLKKLPFRMHFISFAEKESIILLMIVGIIGGMFVVLLGIGGGFIMIPTLIYLLSAKKKYISGTIQMQIFCTSTVSTFIHSYSFGNIDILLSTVMIIGCVIGAKLGVVIANRTETQNYRFILAIVLLLVSGGMLYKLFATPEAKVQIEMVHYEQFDYLFIHNIVFQLL